MRRYFAVVLAAVLITIGLPASPAHAAGQCWVEATAPYAYTSVSSLAYVAGGASNHCSPPATVNSIRLIIQKKKCFLFCYWSNIYTGSTTYAVPGTLDMRTYGAVRFAGYGTYRIYAVGTANNVINFIGGDYSPEVKMSGN